jgi:hypothetical protein
MRLRVQRYRLRPFSPDEPDYPSVHDVLVQSLSIIEERTIWQVQRQFLHP